MKRALENTAGIGENAGNQHFLLFQQCFLLYHIEKSSLVTFNLSFAKFNTLNLVTSKILPFGKELNVFILHQYIKKFLQLMFTVCPTF